MVPFFVLITVYELSRISSKVLSPGLSHILAVMVLVYSLASFSSRSIFNQNWDTYCQSDVLCSEKAVNFLRENQINGKVFNGYRLGGHLIFRYPEMKVYIDGRMTLWEQNGVMPFANYLKIVHTQSGWQELFVKEQFDYIIIQPQYNLARALIENAQWPIIFNDGKVLILKNPQPNTQP